MALRQGPTLRVPHTRDVHYRLRAAASMLNAIKTRYTELQDAFRRMVTVRMNKQKLQEFLGEVFLDPQPGDDEVRYERALTQVRTDRTGAEYSYEMGKGNQQTGVARTLWAAYNGVAEYVDYKRYARSETDRRVEAIWFGDGYSAKARAFSVAERYSRTWAS